MIFPKLRCIIVYLRHFRTLNWVDSKNCINISHIFIALHLQLVTHGVYTIYLLHVFMPGIFVVFFLCIYYCVFAFFLLNKLSARAKLNSLSSDAFERLRSTERRSKRDASGSAEASSS